MGSGRWVSLTVSAVLAIAEGTGIATAQDNVCLNLQAQLAALDSRGGQSDAQYRSYDAAVSQQQAELNQAMAEARRAGCLGGGFLFGPRRPDPKCGQLMSTIDQMRANLTRLTAARDQQGSDPLTVSRQRNDILRQLSYNRCGGNYATYDNGSGNRGILATLFGQARLRTWGEDNYFHDNSQYGTYRTLCVRTCDGYYFPISFSTVQGQFAADQQTCQSMCPGAEVNLYVYHNPGEDPSQMVSVDGQPYTALPTAFRYRTEYDPSCSCHSAAGATASGSGSMFDQLAAQAAALTPGGAVGGPVGMPTPLVPAISAPTPLPAPAPGEDPETLANRAGGLLPQPVGTSPGTAVAAVSGAGDQPKKIRVVGPEYYVAQ